MQAINISATVFQNDFWYLAQRCQMLCHLLAKHPQLTESVSVHQYICVCVRVCVGVCVHAHTQGKGKWCLEGGHLLYFLRVHNVITLCSCLCEDPANLLEPANSGKLDL